MFTFILSTYTWPQIWKCSYITPLHKSGPKTLVTNYRPISILPKVSLILERILFNFIYAKVRHKLSSQQHGFMKGRSTVTQLLNFVDNLYSNYDSNIASACIYFDFQKAFDRVDHDILLNKLILFGFDTHFIYLISSYLKGRVQYVKIDGCFSAARNIPSGVPQGSVLGPLLFFNLYQ